MTRLALALLIALLAAPSAAQAAFPGPNGRIVFESARDDTTVGGVFAMQPDGSDVLHLLADAPSRTDAPAYSATGRMLVYAMNGDIHVANVDGTADRAVTTGNHNDQEPAFSPDGRQIVFHRADAAADLYVVGVDGRDLRDLTNDAAGQETQPDWSPDGSRIAYRRSSCTADIPGTCIYTIPAGGGTPALLTPEHPAPPTCDTDHTVSSADPSWSPDGGRIAFTGIYRCPHAGGLDIWVMNADGSGKVDVTDDDGTNDVHPVWSPDGTRIAFASDRGDLTTSAPDIYSMRADGADIVRLTSESVRDENPSWGVAPTRARPKRVTVTAKRAERRVTVGAKLVLPASANVLCAGSVRITVKAGKRRVARRTAKVGRSCKARAKLAAGKAAGRRSVTAEYRGTRLIAPKRARPRAVR
jgi:TolB protein